MIFRKFILLLLILFTTVSCAESPEVRLKGLDGRDHTFSEYVNQGKWTVVNVWSTSCPYCRMEMPELQEFHDIHKDQDAIVLGLAIDFPSFGYPDPQNVKDFTRDYFIDFPSLLTDADQASGIIGEEISMLPITFFYTPGGERVGRWEGTITRREIEEVIAGTLENTGLLGSGSRGARNED